MLNTEHKQITAVMAQANAESAHRLAHRAMVHGCALSARTYQMLARTWGRRAREALGVTE